MNNLAESWLEEHTVECLRLHAQILPSFCAKYRLNNERCKGCDQAEQMDLAVESQAVAPVPVPEFSGGSEFGKPGRAFKFGRQVPQEKRREVDMSKSKKAVRICADCGREMTIVSRGLCGMCLPRHKRAGDLDEMFPARSKTTPKRGGSDDRASVDGPGPGDVAAVAAGRGADRAAPGDFGVDHFEGDLAMVMAEIRAVLIAENQAYGDRALNSVRVFSKADALEQINVRLDDKLSRLMRGEDAGEDTEADLLGYLVLKRVAMRRAC